MNIVSIILHDVWMFKWTSSAKIAVRVTPDTGLQAVEASWFSSVQHWEATSHFDAPQDCLWWLTKKRLLLECGLMHELHLGDEIWPIQHQEVTHATVSSNSQRMWPSLSPTCSQKFLSNCSFWQAAHHSQLHTACWKWEESYFVFGCVPLAEGSVSGR